MSVAVEAEPGLLYLGGGIFNMIRGEKERTFHLECHFSNFFYRGARMCVRPLLALMGTEERSAYVCWGAACDMFLSERWVISPSFAPGIYMRGHGKDLGYPIELRSALEVSYRWEGGARLGGLFYHLSNASLGDRNPGSEVLLLFFALPLRW